jgi:hypothetical protein
MRKARREQGHRGVCGYFRAYFARHVHRNSVLLTFGDTRSVRAMRAVAAAAKTAVALVSLSAKTASRRNAVIYTSIGFEAAMNLTCPLADVERYCTMSVSCVVCALPLLVAVTVRVYVPVGVDGFGVGVGVGVVELDPPPQPIRSVAADSGSSTKQIDSAVRTVRRRPAGLCVQPIRAATNSSNVMTATGNV